MEEMTNDETRMTKENRLTKNWRRIAKPEENEASLRFATVAFHSSFWFRHSDFRPGLRVSVARPIRKPVAPGPGRLAIGVGRGAAAERQSD